jgi:hypothetical protein
MPQTEDSKSGKQPKYKKFFPGGFWWIVLVAVTLSGVAVYLSRAFTKQTEQYIFIAQAVLNVLIFAAILVQALIYRRQWDSMEQSVELAREALRIGHRPVIGVKTTTFVYPQPGDWPMAEVVWENSGSGMAQQCRVFSMLDIRREQSPAPFFDISQKPEGVRSLAINGTRTSFAVGVEQITPQDIHDIIHDNAWVFVYACVEYTSGRGDEYFTQYCVRYDPRVTKFGEVGDFNQAR